MKTIQVIGALSFLAFFPIFIMIVWGDSVFWFKVLTTDVVVLVLCFVLDQDEKPTTRMKHEKSIEDN